jgi:hypothetical protein
MHQWLVSGLRSACANRRADLVDRLVTRTASITRLLTGPAHHPLSNTMPATVILDYLE